MFVGFLSRVAFWQVHDHVGVCAHAAQISVDIFCHPFSFFGRTFPFPLPPFLPFPMAFSWCMPVVIASCLAVC